MQYNNDFGLNGSDNGLHYVHLDKYCPKKVWEIVIAEEEKSNALPIFNDLAKKSEEYEKNLNITFITFDEIKRFIYTANLDETHVYLPLHLKRAFKDTLKLAFNALQINTELAGDLLAKVIKIKIVDIMYEQYTFDLSKMERKQQLDEELSVLTSSKIMKKTVKIEPKHQDKAVRRISKTGGRKSSNIASLMADDITNTPLDDSEIVLELNIFKRIAFYVLRGFHNPDVINYLLKHDIQITAVIKVSVLGNDKIQDEKYDEKVMKFWNRLNEMQEYPKHQSGLEGTILMKFIINPKEKITTTLREFVNVLRNISEFKLNHMNYIRSLNLCKPKHTYHDLPLYCLESYTKSLNCYPIECINVRVVLNGLLKEVCSRVDNEPYTDSTSCTCTSSTELGVDHTKKEPENICKCPFSGYKNYRKPHTNLAKINKEKPSAVPSKTFICHERDDLCLLVNSYQKIGWAICNADMDVLKAMANSIIGSFDSCEPLIPTHRHDKPSGSATSIKDADIIEHLSHLILLNNLKHRHSEESDACLCRLYKNLMIYDKYKTEVSVVNADETQRSSANVYNICPIIYFWKESLNSGLLLQELAKAQEEFLYVNTVYSDDTDTFLVQFDSDLDSFGLNVTNFDVPLRNPVCLRDFCKYTTVFDYNWLKDNFKEMIIDEPEDYLEHLDLCENLVKKINYLQMYKEYYHLLEMDSLVDVVKDGLTDSERKTAKMMKVLNQLIHYPSHKFLVRHCGLNGDNNLIAYDLGTSFIHLKGSRVIFHSHDDVQLTIDNSRFAEETPKCSVKIESNGNLLMVHSSERFLKDSFLFHVQLASGTIIVFEYNYDITKRKEKITLDLDVVVEPSSIDSFSSQETVETVDLGSNVVSTHLLKGTKQQVVAVNEEYFRTEIAPKVFPKQDGDFDLNKAEIQKNKQFLEHFTVAVDNHYPVYKVNKNYKYLDKLKPTLNQPASTVVNRFIGVPKVDEDELKNVNEPQMSLLDGVRDSRYKHPINFRICLPNGLKITPFPSQIRENLYEIKQAYMTKGPQCDPIKSEVYRIFTRGGHVIIKKLDGTMQILKSDGELVEFSKPKSEEEENEKLCACPTLDACRKKLNKIFQDELTKHGDNMTSRRGQNKTKKINIPEDSFDMTMDFPFRKITTLSFDGIRSSYKDGVLKQKQLFHITMDCDFSAEEQFCDRSDGFRSVIYGNGKQTVQFPDGTKITSEMVCEDFAYGFVLVQVSYIYEHSHYSTVSYTFDSSMEVVFEGEALLKYDLKNKFNLKIQSNISIDISKEDISFSKICPDCDEGFHCTLTTDNFYNQIWEPSSTFLCATDSYNKVFYCDYIGNCSRENTYLSRMSNKRSCNHWSKMCYKKIFAIRRDGSGDMYWNDLMAVQKRRKYARNENTEIVEFQDPGNINVYCMDLKRNFYHSFYNRFVRTNLITDRLCLTKNAKYKKYLFYCTSTVFKQTLSKDNVEMMFKTFLTNETREEGEQYKPTKLDNYDSSKEDNNVEDSVMGNIENLLMDLNKIDEDVYEKRRSVVLKFPPKTPPCKCFSFTLGAKDKMVRWKELCEMYKSLLRNKQIPAYFLSEYYEMMK